MTTAGAYQPSPAEAGEPEAATLLSVRDLRVVFQRRGRRPVHAVDGISLDVEPGRTIGVVGESGCGKSVTSLAILGLLPKRGVQVSGSVRFAGRELFKLSDQELREIRGRELAMIFQDPMTSLNPVLTVGYQITEVLRRHFGQKGQEATREAVSLLDAVGIPEARSRVDSYPHEFSGGMRQRVMIAMALSCEPELLIADEPTTALDVTIQAQILELIKELKRETGTSVILITHDLGVVAGMTDDIIVMYAGKVFERAPTRELFAAPGNPYTKGLLKSVPDPAHEEGTELYQIPGLPPDVAHMSPDQCPFAERCYRAEDVCRREFPPFVRLNAEHFSLCHFAEEVYQESLAARGGAVTTYGSRMDPDGKPAQGGAGR